jgi:hypothetical protein
MWFFILEKLSSGFLIGMNEILIEKLNVNPFLTFYQTLILS